MLFNSYQFILLFVPVVVAVYYALWPACRQATSFWLILASLFFYAWWRPFNVLLITPSIAINYAIVTLLLRLGDRRPELSRAAFWAGIVFNLGFLGYFKYSNFFLTVANDLTGTSFFFGDIVLPLGISFITFQKIALLVDVRAGQVTRVGLRDYSLFVLFFPQLIAGPIVHYRESDAAVRGLRRARAIGRLCRRTHAVLHRPVQEGDLRRPDCRANRADLGAGRHRRPPGAAAGLGGRGRLHAAALLRFLGLFRYGDRRRPPVWRQIAVQLQFSAEGDQHHRFLVTLACHADPVPHRLHLHPVDHCADPQARGPGIAGRLRPPHHAVGISDCARLSDDDHDAAGGCLAWRRLPVPGVRRAARCCAGDQSRMAAASAALVANRGGRGIAGRIRWLGVNIPVRRRRHGFLPRQFGGRRARYSAWNDRRERHHPAGGAGTICEPAADPDGPARERRVGERT